MRLNLIPVFVFLSCSVGASASSAAEKVTYQGDVLPIFRQHCLGCHNSSDARGGLALDSFATLMEGGGSGEVVYDDGDVEGSRLWQLVNHDDTPVMPPDQDRISDAQLAVLRSWIESGALENDGSVAKVINRAATDFEASAEGRPEGGGVMPGSLPLQPVTVTDRPAASTAIAAAPWAPLVAVAGQGQIVFYHADSGELLGIVPFPDGDPQSLRFNRDGSLLVAGGGRHASLGTAVVYDVETGDVIARVGQDFDVALAADVDPELSIVALGGPTRTLRLMDAADGSSKFEINKHTDWILAIAISPDGRWVASADRAGGISIWETGAGRLFVDLPGHKGAVHALDWRDDSKMLYSAGADATVRIWDVEEGKQTKSLSAGGPVFAIDVDHDARVAAGTGQNRVVLFAANGKRLVEFPRGGEAVLEVAISHDGGRIIQGDWSGRTVAHAVEDPQGEPIEMAANPKPGG